VNLCGQVFLCALRRYFCHSTSLQNKKASEKYLVRQETKPNRQTNHEHCIFANFKLSTETNPAIFSSCTHLDLGDLDAAELFLVHGLCTQTRQKEPRETWKSKPCLTTREKHKTDGTLTALSAQLFSLLFLTHKKQRMGELKKTHFKFYLTKVFVQILYNQASVHRVWPRVTKRGGHVTAVVLVRFGISAVNVLESRTSTGSLRSNETSCDLICNDYLEKIRNNSGY